MTKLLAISTLALMSSGVIACPHDLIGTWKSDEVASAAHARSNTKLQPQTKEFLGALWGHMTLSFAASELHVSMPSIEVPISGVSKPFAGFEERKLYTVVFCNRFSLVFTSKQPFGAEPTATTLNFVDPDVFWVYSGGTDPATPDLHAREFFRRVR